MNICRLTVLLVTLASHGVLAQSSLAVDWFFSQRQRIKTRCALPDHAYSDNSWPFTTQNKFGATVIAVAATDADTSKDIKPFHFRARKVAVEPVILDKVGLALNANGRLYASGRFTHTGGDGGLTGANVTVHIRAYVAHTAAAAPRLTVMSTPAAEPATATSSLLGTGLLAATDAAPAERAEMPIATPNRVTRLPPDAYRVWSSEKKLWVSRGLPQHVTLTNPGIPTDALRHHFDEITHLEVEVVYERVR